MCRSGFSRDCLCRDYPGTICPEMNDWRSRLLAAVSPLESGVRGLQVSGFRPPDSEAHRPSRTAAVLVAILDMPEPQLVLTRRADHLPQHPGQVCFPGGAAEDNDRSAVQTALREAQEEIGLPPEAARPIGFLDRMDTISDYRVLPVVALVTPPVNWTLDTREVAEVFTVPLVVALDRQRYQGRTVERDGHRYTVWSLRWGEYDIWGATAAMLLNLITRMEKPGEFEHPGIRSGT
jgi:8-oxo-dGTP pyrophosphatase MutT (NUDIX family)